MTESKVWVSGDEKILKKLNVREISLLLNRI